MRVIILLALLGAAFAGSRNASRIVGGSLTNIETYPYMANLQRQTFVPWTQACGGSLITSTAVLSAAHCFYGDQLWQWRVVLGSSFAHRGGTVHTISRIVMHPQYDDSTINNDVAVVRLSNAAVFSSSVQTASIVSPNYVVPDGAIVTHIGWGRIRVDGPASEQLRHVDINIINQELCAHRYDQLKAMQGYENWPVITSGMVCAGILDEGGKDACSGDSGGPLALNRNIIVGVTSWGFECADPFLPGVSARVSQYSNWIVANVI